MNENYVILDDDISGAGFTEAPRLYAPAQRAQDEAALRRADRSGNIAPRTYEQFEVGYGLKQLAEQA